MPLIKCIECGNEISDKAKTCPHCGCKLNRKAKKKGKKIQKREELRKNIQAAQQKQTQAQKIPTWKNSNQSPKKIPPILGWIVSVLLLLLALLFLTQSAKAAALTLIAAVAINPIFRQKTKFQTVIAVLFVAVLLIAAVVLLPEEDNDLGSADKTVEETMAEELTETESSELELDYSASCDNGVITIKTESNCPDGTILQVLLIDASAEEEYNDKPVVKNGKTESTFDLRSDSYQIYSGTIALQFNADGIKQPKSTREKFGKRGQKMTGHLVNDVTTTDNKDYKYASIVFTVPYPSDTAIADSIFQSLVDSSSGLILNIQQPMPDNKEIVYVFVSNEWYLMTESEKQYIAETVDDTLTTTISNLYDIDYCAVDFIDPSGDTVATSKITGGMKIKK